MHRAAKRLGIVILPGVGRIARDIEPLIPADENDFPTAAIQRPPKLAFGIDMNFEWLSTHFQYLSNIALASKIPLSSAYVG
jgi:hypothetical protein